MLASCPVHPIPPLLAVDGAKMMDYSETASFSRGHPWIASVVCKSMAVGLRATTVKANPTSVLSYMIDINTFSQDLCAIKVETLL